MITNKSGNLSNSNQSNIIKIYIVKNHGITYVKIIIGMIMQVHYGGLEYIHVQYQNIKILHHI